MATGQGKWRLDVSTVAIYAARKPFIVFDQLSRFSGKIRGQGRRSNEEPSNMDKNEIKSGDSRSPRLTRTAVEHGERAMHHGRVAISVSARRSVKTANKFNATVNRRQ